MRRTLTTSFAVLCLTSATIAQGQPIEQVRLQADKGDVKAQIELGLRYFNAEGVRQDDDQAERWLQKALAQDATKAYIALGWFYINADMPKRDRDRGVALYLLAAERGDIEAMFNLAEQYELGRGVLKNESHDEAAVRLFRKVADHGDPEAMNHLALHYEEGSGVPRDHIEAYKWWSIAAARATATRRKDFTQDRDFMARESMTPSQIATAQQLVRGWLAAFAKRQ